MYNGHVHDDFVVQRTSAYIDQVDLRHSFVSSLGTGALQEYYIGHQAQLHGAHDRSFLALSVQSDNHLSQLSVRQTLDFAARCQGAGFGEYSVVVYAMQIYPS